MVATKYPYTISTDFSSGKVSTDRLKQEIEQSSIVTALDRIDTSGGVCDVWFKATLSAADKTTLDNDADPPTTPSLIYDHDGTPLAPASEEVIVQEEQTKTGGHFQPGGFIMSVPATVGWHEHAFSFPIPITLMSAEALCFAENHGDFLYMAIAPNTVIGAITAAEAVGQTVLSVSQSVIDNTALGYFLALDDGTNHDDLGQVVAIDPVALTVTVETATVNAFVATDAIQQTVRMGQPKMPLRNGHQIVLGATTIGGSYLAANTPLKMMYENVDGVAKEFAWLMEYKY